ncbi:Lrp/AsnC family transcriptional regulator [Paenarthrobacter sp. YIM B13468]|uniref:Lrp/AsnC family transcriptional regulator n=2 Tax=Micrococcaceae TaxID=1268 RepID=UPI00366EDC4D
MAKILGGTPVSVAARWHRLSRAGSAWITAYPAMKPRNVLLCYIELDCAPGTKPSVQAQLLREPRVVTVEESARGRDLLLTVMCPDLDEVTKFALDDLPAIPGVLRPRTHFVTKLHSEGNNWRLDALSPEQRRRCESLARTSGAEQVTQLPGDAWPLIQELAKDGRATAADLARATGRNTATVRRQLSKIIGSGALSFRCELAQGRSRWPVTCTFLARIPPADLDRTIAALKTLPEMRVCVSTTGSTNMLFSVWMSSIEDLHQVERRFGTHLPWLEIIDSAVTLRNPKRMGWILNSDGSSTGQVIVPAALRPTRIESAMDSGLKR